MLEHKVLEYAFAILTYSYITYIYIYVCVCVCVCVCVYVLNYLVNVNLFGLKFVRIVCRIQAFQQGNLDLVSGSVRKIFYALNRPDSLRVHPAFSSMASRVSFPRGNLAAACNNSHSLARRLKFCRLFSAMTL